MNRREFLNLASSALAGAMLHSGCSEKKDIDDRPNILWIVWDTVRSDHLSLYGHKKSTTPFLDNWSQGGQVFDNCISVANCTVPAHASMFTGLMPSEHTRNNRNNYLDDSFTTISELLQTSGYRTYLYSANPHISRSRNFNHGFDKAEHPWDEQYLSQAYNIVKQKLLPEDKTSKLVDKIQSRQISNWSIKASGELAQQGIQAWLKNSNCKQPFFAFLNYMEAHQPYIPQTSYRKRLMRPDQVEKSYLIDRSLDSIWSYTFGQKHFSDEEIEITRLTYDAAIAELDELLKNLLTSLQNLGHLDNTMVILTSDHGEHLGEQHMLDHQYSVYEPLLRVPLVIHYPDKFAPGRIHQPVVNYDLFPTILALANIEMPHQLQTEAVNLLLPPSERIRMAECLSFPEQWFLMVKKLHPDFDPAPWRRTLRALYQDGYKYIWTSDKQPELYNLASDKTEKENLIEKDIVLAGKMAAIHDKWQKNFQIFKAGLQRDNPLSEEEKNRLKSLGYLK